MCIRDRYIGFGYWVGSIFSERLILDFGMPMYLTFLTSIGRTNNFALSFRELTNVDEVSWLTNIAIPYLLVQVKLK